ncbi:hypothetical protein [Borrelia sp. RT1S]|uniref:hypothetical protein n=1 Tax=Borrelia sp. RT1S TaxID=2898580 RepID=UPI001E3C448A|nr:hypothetical protein [Borrelia sp. RT1S]UGQ17975.1 hypothetical protein LSO05_05945 [Borrelia sp. RT1S]
MKRISMVVFLILVVALVACKKDGPPGGAMYKYKYEKCEYYKQKYEKYKRKKQKHEEKNKHKKNKHSKYSEYDECDVYRPDYDDCGGGNCEKVAALKAKRDEYINLVIDVEIKIEIKIESLATNNEAPVQSISTSRSSTVTDVQAMLAELDKTTIKVLGEHLTDENLEKIENDQEKLNQVAGELDKFITSRDTFVDYLKKMLTESGSKVGMDESQRSVVENIQSSEVKIANLVNQ